MISTQLKSFLEALELGLSFPGDLPESFEAEYKIINARKRGGGTRVLKIPSKDLKWLQTRILRDWLVPNFQFPPHVHGGIKHRSPRTNAMLHLNSEVVINIDLLNFFDSVKTSLVETALKRLGLEADLRLLIAKLCTVDDGLPQGAPTSSFLANLTALELDDQLIKIAQARSLSYSRYIDDITFSGTPNVDSLMTEIEDCLIKSPFVLNPDKTRIQRSHRRQTVTQVVVNKRLSTAKPVLRKLRQDLYYCHKYGIYGHCQQAGIESQSRFVKSLAARIGYVMSVDQEAGTMLLKQFRSLKDEQQVDRHCQRLALQLASICDDRASTD